MIIVQESYDRPGIALLILHVEPALAYTFALLLPEHFPRLSVAREARDLSSAQPSHRSLDTASIMELSYLENICDRENTPIGSRS